MALSPFSPADGKVSRLRHCYGLVASREAGDVISVEEVMELCDCDRPTAIQAMWSVKAPLERDGLNSLEIIRPGGGGRAYGWRILDRGVRNLDVVDARVAKSRRAQVRVSRLINNTERDRLDQVGRMRYDRLQSHALRAAVLYERRPSSLADLQRKAEEQRRKQLPGRDPDDGSRTA
jgi:hypothetical protein